MSACLVYLSKVTWRFSNSLYDISLHDESSWYSIECYALEEILCLTLLVYLRQFKKVFIDGDVNEWPTYYEDSLSQMCQPLNNIM